MADRAKMLKEIQEIGFTIDDLALYLGTHPLDTEALDCFSQAGAKKKQLMENYARQFEPLTMACVCPDTNNETQTHCKYPGQKHFTWCDGPLPWDNQGGACPCGLTKNDCSTR